MNNRDLDMFQKLENYASPIDLDRMWAGIEPELPKATDRNPFVWWPWALIVACVLAGAYFFWFGSARVKKQSNPEVSPQVKSVPALSPKIERQSDIVQAMPAQTIKPVADTEQKTMGHTIPMLRQSDTEKQSQNVSSITQPVVGANAAAHQTSVADLSEKMIRPSAQAEEMNNQIAFATKPFQIVSLLSRLPQVASILPVPFIAPDFARPDPQTGCYDWSGRKSRLRPYVGIYGGGHLPMRSIEAKSAEFTNWAASRTATETRLEAVNAGAFFGLQAKNGLSIDAGIEYMRINERFKASDTTTSIIGQIVTTGFIVNAPGDTTFITETLDITETTVNTRTTFNRYNFFSIPIGIAYTFNQKHAVKPYIKAGAQFNVSARQKVGMLDANGQYQLYSFSNTSASTYPFRAQVGVIPFVQVGARVALTGALEAFGEVRYLHMLRDVTNDNFALNQRYSTLGAQLGLRLGL